MIFQWDIGDREPCRPWWAHHRFSLVPVLLLRGGDEWNRPAWSFDWLIFRAWNLDHVALEVDARFGKSLSGGELWIGAVLPYLRIGVRVPVPGLGWVHDRLALNPPQQSEFDPEADECP